MWYLGGHVNAGVKIMAKIKRRFRLAWACYKQLKWELYDTEAAPFTLKVNMLKAEGMTNVKAALLTLKMLSLKVEVMAPLPYGRTTWTLGKEHYADTRIANHRLHLRIIRS